MTANYNTINAENGQQFEIVIKSLPRRPDSSVDEGIFGIVPVYFLQYGMFLSRKSIRVYIALRSFNSYQTGICDPTIEQLKDRTKYSKTTILEALAELIYFKWIRRYKNKTAPRYKNNQYRVQNDFLQPKVKDALGREKMRLSPTETQAKAFNKKIENSAFVQEILNAEDDILF